MVLIVFQRLILQFVLDVLYFPVWWYTTGLFRVIRSLFNSFLDTNISLAPGLWLKNILTPMYGQRDIEGRLMSVFMRIINIIGRSIALFIWIWILILALAVWLIVPVMLIIMIALTAFLH